MIAEIKKQYTKKQRLKAKEHSNIYDVFDELISKIEVFSSINHEDNSDLNFGIYMYVEDIKDHIKGLEYQLKREILKGKLKI